MRKIIKIILLAATFTANVCMVGCNKEDGLATEMQTTEVTKQTEEKIQERTEEKRDYMSEAQQKIEEGLFEEAEELYREFYEIEGNQEALISVLNMWIKEGNDTKVKEWVQYAKDHCGEPSDELTTAITRGENCKWMITNVKGINEDDAWFVEYNEEGRIASTNIDLCDGNLARHGSRETENHFEYLDDGRVKFGSAYYTYDEEDGRIIQWEYTDDEGINRTMYYQYTGVYEYDEDIGITYDEKRETIYYKDGVYDSKGYWEYKNYTGYKIDVFPICGDYTVAGVIHNVDNTFDEYDNLVRRYELCVNWNNKYIQYGFELEYAYCTPDEYFAAKENNDFSAYKVSNYDTYLAE